MKNKNTWISIAILCVLSVAGYFHLFKKGEIVYSKYSDIITEHFGNLCLLSGQMKNSGGFPFWRGDQFSGYPAFSNPQMPCTNPFYIPYYFSLPAGNLNFIIWLQILACGLSFFFAGRMLGLKNSASLFIGVAGIFSFKLLIMVYAGLLPLIPGVIFLPLLFALAFRLLQAPNLSRTIAFAFLAAVSLLSGHFQLVYYTLVFIFFYFIWHGFWLIREKQGRLIWQKILPWGLVSIVLCLGLTAFKLLPFALEIPLLSRSDMSYSFFLFRNAIGLKHLGTFIFPEILGTPLNNSYAAIELWEDALYIGLIPFIFALLGLGYLIKKRKSATGNHFFSFAALTFFLSLALAFNTPLLKGMFHFFPGYHFFRIPSRIFHLTAFFAMILAGFGFEQTWDALRNKFTMSQAKIRVYIALLLAIMAAEGSYYARRYLESVPLQQIIPRQTVYQSFFNSDRDLFRIAPIYRRAVNYGWSVPLGLQLITGYDSYNLKNYQLYLDILRFGQPVKQESRVWADFIHLARPDLLDNLNVKYLISPLQFNLDPQQFQLIRRLTNQPLFVFYEGFLKGDLFVYQNLKMKSRAFWVDRVAGVANEEEMIQRLSAEKIHDTAFVLSEAKPVILYQNINRRVQIQTYANGHLRIETQNDQPGFLCISESWHPGWKAILVDSNRPIPILQTNLSLMGVHLPPGRHTLKIDFRPLQWNAARWISVGTLILVLLLLGLNFFRRRRNISHY